MAKAKKPKTTSEYWERVFVITGEPLSCRFAIPAVIEQVDAGGIRRFFKEDKTAGLRTAFSSFSLSEKPEAVLVSNPSADQLKVCLEAVLEGPFVPPALIVYSPGDIDGRLGFVSAATKQKRIYSYPYVEKSDRSGLWKYLSEWQSGTGVKLDTTARDWLTSSAPTMNAKIKSQTGTKRDVEVIDLESLENELDKVAIVRQNDGGAATLEDVQSLCCFEQVTDVWQFIEAAVQGNTALVFKLFDKMLNNSDATGAMHLLMSQLKFLINLKSTPGHNEHLIALDMSLNRYVGKYLLPDWTKLEEPPTVTAINPWRVKKALETAASLNVETLSRQYCAVTYAVKDLRFGYPADILMPYLVLALCGLAKYESPLTS